jgi:hypothetical protein
MLDEVTLLVINGDNEKVLGKYVDKIMDSAYESKGYMQDVKGDIRAMLDVVVDLLKAGM